MADNAVITPAMHVLAAKSFIQNMNDKDNPIYGFAGRPQDWSTANGKAHTVSNSLAAQTEAIRDIIFAKKLTSKNAHLAFQRQDYVKNKIYTVWSTQTNKLYKTSVKAGQMPCYTTIKNSDGSVDVFMCIFNNYDSLSTVAPNTVEGYKSYKLIRTSDKYIWKWLFDVPKNLISKWSHPSDNRFYPIPVEQSDKSQAYKLVEEQINNLPFVGDILQINILNGGKIKSYTGPSSGVSSIWKIVISGTGQDADFAVEEFEVVSSGTERVKITTVFNETTQEEEDVFQDKNYWIYTIKKITPINYGTNYTSAKAELVLLEKDASFVKENNNPVYCNFDVLLNPERLLGKNIAEDICARFVTAKVEFVDDERGEIEDPETGKKITISHFPTEMLYRQVGIAKDLKTRDGNLITSDKVYYYNTMTIVSATKQFDIGSTILGNQSGATAYIVATMADNVISHDSQTLLLTNVTDDFYLAKNLTTDSNEQIEHRINVNGISEVTGTAIIDSFIKNNNDPTQGTILYLNNFDAITRQPSKKETFFLTFEL